MMRATLVAGVLGLMGCETDETVAAFAGDATVFALQSLDGAPFPASATLDVGTPGQITGDAPCNSYSADQSAPYPWFAVGPIAATRRACSDLAAETTFFDALAAMTLVEVVGETLILSNTDGGEMVFQAIP